MCLLKGESNLTKEALLIHTIAIKIPTYPERNIVKCKYTDIIGLLSGSRKLSDLQSLILPWDNYGGDSKNVATLLKEEAELTKEEAPQLTFKKPCIF